MSATTTTAQLLERVAIEVSTLAAAEVRSVIGRAEATGTKSSPTDVVTDTDLRTERLIRDELAHRCPGSAIVGEEYDDDNGANNVGWIVDPIDGTVNFLYDLPVISVSIAATIDGTVVAGAVADVHRGEVFSAAAGHGARLDGAPVAIGEPAGLAQALIATGFSYDAAVRGVEAQTVAKLLPACGDIRCMGSAALNLCWVGSGRLDGHYQQGLRIYDYAAGALIAAEAGARVEQPTQNETELLLTAPPNIFDSLRALITDSGRS